MKDYYVALINEATKEVIEEYCLSKEDNIKLDRAIELITPKDQSKIKTIIQRNLLRSKNEQFGDVVIKGLRGIHMKKE
jgi:hypothetical protein